MVKIVYLGSMFSNSIDGFLKTEKAPKMIIVSVLTPQTVDTEIVV